MIWRIAYTDRAKRDFRALDRGIAARVSQALNRLAETGYGDVTRVRGWGETLRLRVGDWRVFFSWDRDENVIRVLSVRHRREAYRE